MIFRKPLGPIGLLLSSLLASPSAAQEPPAEPKGQATKTTAASGTVDLTRQIKGRPLLEDLDQFRSVLKQEWMLSNLNDADFNAAVDAIARDEQAGMTIAELAIRLQRVLAMGRDGHSGISQFPGAMQTVRGVRPDFLIDISGNGYTAYRVERAAGGPVNPRFEHRFIPLKNGYPHLLAIDGMPITEWVDAASPYIYKGPTPALRWRAMQFLQELPFLRRELHVPNASTIRVRLASSDRKEEVEIDAPTNAYPRFHFAVPKPEWRVLAGNIGCLWVEDMRSAGAEAIMRGMAQAGGTRGMVIDLRDNQGGGMESLQLVCDYLLPPDRPRFAAGRIVHWEGGRRHTNTAEVSAITEGLSPAGRQFLTTFEQGFKPKWQPPKGRPLEQRTVFLARAEAEPALDPYNIPQWPKSSHYSGPVVVLFNERCFSAAEIFLAGVRELPGVTLVGSAATAGGGGSPESHHLQQSGLDVMLSGTAFVRRDGTLIDGRGIVPDVIVEPDADYYLGGRDRMLERAVEVLEEKIRSIK